jgi:hypothetical protein
LATFFVPLDDQMREDLLADPAFDANGGGQTAVSSEVSAQP